MSTVYVTNKWEKPITFNYAYKTYTFPVGESVEAPLEAVCHIFGHGVVDKVPYMVQLALIQTTNDIPRGLKILEKFEITDQPQRKDHLLSPVVERVPLPEKVGGKPKNSTPNG